MELKKTEYINAQCVHYEMRYVRYPWRDVAFVEVIFDGEEIPQITANSVTAARISATTRIQREPR